MGWLAISSIVGILSIARVLAQSSSTCATTLSASVAAPSVASGYEVALVATGLTSPRDILFDTAGRLLIVQQGVGVQALTLQDNGGLCVTASSRKTVISDSTLNHGIALSPDGKTLYASSVEAVYQYTYDASTASIIGGSTTIVNNMTNGDHVTRTLLLSKKQVGTLIVTRGSGSNLDADAEVLSSGHSQIKAFNLLTRTGTYDFLHDGMLLGWGMRNDVGIDEHPSTGGLYSVENGADNVLRMGVDIHQNNPAEEMNYLGTLNNNVSPNQGGNFGYPQCFSAWDVSSLPNNANIQVGTQFAIDDEFAAGYATAADDALCLQRVAPRLVFQAHMAPLAILFNNAGTEAWITFHEAGTGHPLL